MNQSPIDNIVKDINDNQIESIKGLIDRKEAEQFYIEFKTAEMSDYVGKRSIGNNDRKNLAKAISGFSNSEGGVLIWGVDTNKGDMADKLKPINGFKNFSTLLSREFGTLVIPANTRVYNIEIINEENTGFVATVIPKSNKAPHEYIKENRYYLRAGESFQPVPYSVLAGMFGKRPAPEIILNFIYNKNVKNTLESVNFSFGIVLANKGMGIARNVFLNSCILGAAHAISTEIFDRQNFVGSNLGGNHTFLISKDEFKLGIEQPIQPLKFHCEIPKSVNMHLGIEFLYGAEGQPPQRMTILHNAEKIKELVHDIELDGVNDFPKRFLSNFSNSET